jgi:hypothetical protein
MTTGSEVMTMLDDEEYQPSAAWGNRPANGGDAFPSRTPVAGDIPPAGPARLLAARLPTPPELRTPNAGGRAFMAPPASPSDNAGGAFAMAMGSQSTGNGGSPNVVHTPYGGPFGSYSGNPQPPRPASVGAPAEPMQPPKSGALDDFMARHAPQQGGGQQGGPQQQGGADEAEEGEAGAGEAAEAGAGEAAGAGAAEGAAGIGSVAEMLGFL